ncbi:MAG: Gfo/Idh/MocA family oxidoreductase [Pseudomonadota bacterium]
MNAKNQHHGPAVRLAVIGCGYWGKNLIRNFNELGVLKAVCDLNQDQAMLMASQYNVDALPLEQILQDDHIDAIAIASPAVKHFEHVKISLQANKHVFVEKPMSLTIAEAVELCKLNKKTNKTLMVGHLLQYHPAFIKLKMLIREGYLGKIQYIYSNRLNLGKFRHEENILWSFAPHDISMTLALAGDIPKTVFATGSSYLNPDVHDITTTHLTFANGLNAHIFVSWLHPFKEQKLIVVGHQKMAVFDDGLDWNQKLKIYPHQINWINGQPSPQKSNSINISIPPEEPLKLEVQHFIESITQNKTPRTDAIEGLNVLKTLNMAQQSLMTRSMVHQSSDHTNEKNYDVHESAYIDENCDIDTGTKIWHHAHILKNTKIGKNCIIGKNVMIGPDVIVGNGCKIQNNVSLYKGVILNQNVFCGPSCVFTNVHNQRAEIEKKDEFLSTHVEQGVTIGANATIICGNRLGAYSLIGAGAVITKDVKPHAVMAGNPAKQIGWVSHAGEKLDNQLTCPREKRQYRVDKDGYLTEILSPKQPPTLLK